MRMLIRQLSMYSFLANGCLYTHIQKDHCCAVYILCVNLLLLSQGLVILLMESTFTKNQLCGRYYIELLIKEGRARNHNSLEIIALCIFYSK